MSQRVSDKLNSKDKGPCIKKKTIKLLHFDGIRHTVFPRIASAEVRS